VKPVDDIVSQIVSQVEELQWGERGVADVVYGRLRMLPWDMPPRDEAPWEKISGPFSGVAQVARSIEEHFLQLKTAPIGELVTRMPLGIQP